MKEHLDLACPILCNVAGTVAEMDHVVVVMDARLGTFASEIGIPYCARVPCADQEGVLSIGMINCT